MCCRQGLGGPSVRANIVSAILISGRVSVDVGRVGMAEQDVGVGLVQVQQQQFAVNVELVGVVEHFDLGLSLLRLQHRNFRRCAHPGASVKSSLCVCPLTQHAAPFFLASHIFISLLKC